MSARAAAFTAMDEPQCKGVALSFVTQTEDQLAKIDVREGDRILVWLDITRVSENALDEQVVTVSVPGQKVTATLKSFEVVKHEKGRNWPS